MTVRFLLLTFIFTLTAFVAKAENPTIFLAHVVTVLDGDSIEIETVDGKKTQVRLLNIDAPEQEQPHSQKSTEMLASLVDGKEVWVIQKGTDKYNRILAYIFPVGTDTGFRMIEKGAAWAYRYYNPPKAYLSAENKAKSEKEGLWALPKKDRQAPWDWRHAHPKEKK